MATSGKTIRLQVATRLTEARKKRKLTQEGLAALSGVEYKYIQRIEGKNPPNMGIETLAKLASALKIPLSKLIS